MKAGLPRLLVHLSSERTRQAVPQHCSFAKKQTSLPALLVVVRGEPWRRGPRCLLSRERRSLVASASGASMRIMALLQAGTGTFGGELLAAPSLAAASCASPASFGRAAFHRILICRTARDTTLSIWSWTSRTIPWTAGVARDSDNARVVDDLNRRVHADDRVDMAMTMSADGLTFVHVR
jgi:hypothetical protein